MRASLVALHCLMASSAWASESARHLKLAQSMLERFDLRAAAAEATRALEAGDSTVDETWQLHAVLAQAHAAMGQADAALERFRCTLELQPAFVLPADASPKLTAPYREARRQLAGSVLRLRVTSAAAGPGLVETTVEAEGDANGLVRAGSLSHGSGPAEAKLPLVGPFPLRVKWPCSDTCAYRVVVVDAHGNALAQAGTAEHPLEVRPSLFVETPAPRPSRPWYARPWVYGAAGVALAGVALYFGLHYTAEERQLLALTQDRANSDYARVQALDAARHREHAFMWGAIGLAAIAAGAAILTF
ncbi:MAG: hypothetical protein IPJ65_40205 [Archangiaceae bacterium]|nr:hypothetical protein [Archangiaceae bacterium]